VSLEGQPGGDGDQFGFAVATTDTIIVVGAPRATSAGPSGPVADAGVVYVFDATGALVATLLNPSAAPGDRFGFALAAEGNRIVVGAPGDDQEADDGGIAYVYDGDAAAGMLSLTTSLVNPNAGPADQFGAAVAIDGQRVVVGAPFDGATVESGGAAYVFDAIPQAPRRLEKPSPATGDLFGAAVAAANGITLVGAPSADTTGAVYVFEGTGAPRRLASPTPVVGSAFGSALALLGQRVAVGAPLANAVHVLEPGGAPERISSPSPVADGRFGFALAASGATLVVGAPNEGAGRAGRVYVFVPSRCGGVVCDDQNACTVDACDPPTGDCMFTPDVVCDDQDLCTADACDPASGQCFFETTCEERNGCTSQVCEPGDGVCVIVGSVACDDRNPCTSESCDALTGACVTTPATVCDDGDPCTVDDCDPSNGECRFSPTACDDRNSCTIDVCEPGTGACSHSGGACDPATGRCADTDASCDDGNGCTDDACDSGTASCVFTPRLGCGDSTAPSVPTGFTGEAATCSTIALRWFASFDDGIVAGYDVFRNFAFLERVPAPMTSTVDRGLAASTVYAYRLTAVDGAGNSSAPSATLSVVTPVCPTTTVTTTSATTTNTTTTASSTSTTTLPVSRCDLDADCADDGNPCTRERCRTCDGCFFRDWPCCAARSPTYCVRGRVPNGTSCDDGDPCTGDAIATDRCQAGICVPGPRLSGTPDVYGAVACQLQGALRGSPCTVPNAVARKVEKATRRLDATGAKPTQQKKRRQLRRALALLGRAWKATNRLERNDRIAGGCAAFLRDLMQSYRGSVGGLLDDLRT
ncbi:MAG TPA: hypothetical protein VKA21_11650, partial [Candidatus Binatia bacterium]|nr:hypothetical protein [Candidatus Binatia bacterium]